MKNIYARSRVKTDHNIYCAGESNRSGTKVNKDILLKYEHLKRNDLFSTVNRNAVSGDTVIVLTVLVHNVRSLSRHADDIVIDNRIINFN